MYQIEHLVVGSYQANCYLLTNEAGTLVIDPGAQADYILDALEGRDTIGIVVTHCHSDHIGAVNEIVEATGAWVACGVDDVDGMADTHRSGFDLEGSDYAVTQCDRALKEGETLTWGSDSLTVIHTPGHTPGSICLADETSRYLFSGDMLFAGSIGSTLWVLGDDAAMSSSCDKLAALPGEYWVLPGHGVPTELSVERAMLRSYAAHLRRQLKASWREGE
ncbi:MBL fold metallo-hydrolase [Schaalia suimastitidis]|uniref:MBL fold metallo-hydrolase n=1 Tax=Schaalia suimastitidis TaxID=121163 RepID=UPI00042308E4|nr:MBL fold metallo-hydrolase [Schaalia suimastitidis]